MKGNVFARWTLVLSAVVVITTAPGCGSGPKGTEDEGRASAAPLSPVVYLIPGRTAVVPVALSGPINGSGSYPVKFGEETLEASLWWIGVSSAAGPNEASPVRRATSIAARTSAWMGLSQGGAPWKWGATAASEGVLPASAGTWAVVIRPPAGASPAAGDPRRLRLGAHESEVRWLEDPATPGSWRPESPLSAATRQSPWLRGALDMLAKSPEQRWRARLALGRPLGRPSNEDEGASPTPTDMFLDPVLNTLATQIELQWLVGLSRLANEDEALAKGVIGRLCMVSDFGGGIVMPMWDVDNAATAQLLELLLAPEAVAGDLAQRARVWLDARPSALVWTSDDAGATDAVSGAFISTLIVANLTEEPLVAWAVTGGEVAANDMWPVQPHIARRISAVNRWRPGAPAEATGAGEASGGAGEGGEEPAGGSPFSARGTTKAQAPAATVAASRAARDGQVLRVRVGVDELRRRACPDRLPAIPPGAMIGPLRRDWTLRTIYEDGSSLTEAADNGPWSARRADDPEWATVGVVYLGSAAETPVASPAGGAGEDQWMLYVECLRGGKATGAATAAGDAADASASAAAGDGAGRGSASSEGTLRVWLGPTGTPAAVFSVSPQGEIHNDASPVEGGGGTSVDVPASARVAMEPSRWSCWIPLPHGAIEADGTLRIGLERIDSRGVRSAWPRAELPWQGEPGRAAIDTRGWTKVSP